MGEWLIWECPEAGCRLRFPAAAHERVGGRCPRCGGQTVVVRHVCVPGEAAALPGTQITPQPILPLAALLDNIRSLFNVGSIFRSADGAGIQHLYLCGVTPTPAQPKLAKTALGAERSVGWSQHNNAIDLARTLLANGWGLWALEAGDAAQSIWCGDLPRAPLVLVVGSEVTGVDPDLLALCQGALAIPMAGHKRSLNVATAFGVAAVILRQRMGEK